DAGIDDERLRSVVGPDLKAYLVVAEQGELAVYVLPHATDVLVKCRRVLDKRPAARRRDDQVAACVERESAGAGQLHANRVGGATAGNLPIIFELPLLVAIKLKADARVDVLDPRAEEGCARHAGGVVEPDRQALRIGADELHRDGLGALRAGICGIL